MTPNRPIPPEERDRQVGRLSSINRGAAAAATIGVVGLGALAAVSYPGASAGAAARPAGRCRRSRRRQRSRQGSAARAAEPRAGVLPRRPRRERPRRRRRPPPTHSSRRRHPNTVAVAAAAVPEHDRDRQRDVGGAGYACPPPRDRRRLAARCGSRRSRRPRTRRSDVQPLQARQRARRAERGRRQPRPRVGPAVRGDLVGRPSRCRHRRRAGPDDRARAAPPRLRPRLRGAPGRRRRGTASSSSTSPGWRTVELDPTQRTVRTAPGVELDLGSTGKALAADLAATAALSAVGPSAGVLVNLGGDIAIAGTAPADGWPIRVGDDSRADPRTARSSICAGDAMATSSTTVRRWTAGGIVRHHIIDPRTGQPAEGPWRTATVAAATCVDANAASTAAIVLGDAAPRWLEERRLPARLVGLDGTVTRVAGWPQPLAEVA